MAGKKGSSGKYEKKKEICPDCGAETYLPLHKIHCPGKDPADIPAEDQEILTASDDIQFAEDSEDLHPKMDTNIIDGMKSALTKAGKKAKEIGDKGRLMTESEFREFVKLSDKVFDFFDVPHLKFTDEELDQICPDMYYLLKHYAPDVLRYLRSDFIRLARLIVNCLKIIKTKIIVHKIAKGEASPEEAQKMFDQMINSPELEPYKEAITAFAGSMDDIKKGLADSVKAGKLPSQKKAEIKQEDISYSADALVKPIQHNNTEVSSNVREKKEISDNKNGGIGTDESGSAGIGKPEADRKAESRSRKGNPIPTGSDRKKGKRGR